jgi:hypothetical protein
MAVRLRLPNGKNMFVNISTDEKVQYLFDFIYSLENENLGFEDEE